MKEIINKVKHSDKAYICIFLVSIFAMLPLISNKYYYGDDTVFHAASIIGLSKDLFNGKILSYIAGSLGYGEGIFYPQLSHYISAIILIIIQNFGFGVIASMKITHFLNVFIAGICMYQLMREILKNKKTALIVSIFYVTIPYFLRDIYLRDAQAESLLFVFLPLLLRGLYKLYNKDYKKFIVFFTIAYVGLIYSHLVLTMYITFLGAIIILLNFKNLITKESIKYVLISALLIIIFAMPFIIPMLENRFNTYYYVFLDNAMSSVSNLNLHRMGIYEFIKLPEYSSCYGTNMLVLILALSTIFKYRKITDNSSKFIIKNCIIIAILSGILMSKLINWEKVPYFLLLIQFPWRLQVIFNFAICVLAGFTLDKENMNKIITFLCLISCIFYTVRVQNVQIYKKYDIIFPTEVSKYTNEYKQKMLVEELPANMDLSEVTKFYHEYYPLYTIANIHYLIDRDLEIKIMDGKADIFEYLNQEKITFTVKNVQNARIELPRLYYLGYSVVETLEDGRKVNIGYYQNKNGFVEFEIEHDGKIEVKYTGTYIDKIVNLLAIITFVAIILYIIQKNKNQD